MVGGKGKEEGHSREPLVKAMICKCGVDLLFIRLETGYEATFRPTSHIYLETCFQSVVRAGFLFQKL